MTGKRAKGAGDYAVGKGRPPKASRWRKGQSGNPKGRSRRPPGDAEIIDRLFRRRFTVLEAGAKVVKTGFSLIHTQLLIKESAGHRRAGRTRDRYEAFARAHADISGVQLRYVVSDLAPNSAGPGESARRIDANPENMAPPAGSKARADLDVAAPDDRVESNS
jgi:hypothetical protein